MLVPVVLIPFWSGWTVLRPPVTAHYMEVGFKSLCCCWGSARRGLIVGLSRTGFPLFYGALGVLDQQVSRGGIEPPTLKYGFRLFIYPQKYR